MNSSRAMVSPDSCASSAFDCIAPATPIGRAGRSTLLPIVADRPHSFTDFIVSPKSQRHPNAGGCVLLRSVDSVKRRIRSVNRHDHPYAQRLKPFIRAAVSSEPVKVLALKTGISADVLRDLKEERRMPHVPTFLELAKRDPALKAQVIAILSGDAEASSPERINELVRFFQQK
jgi:hypothetical protein